MRLCEYGRLLGHLFKICSVTLLMLAFVAIVPSTPAAATEQKTIVAILNFESSGVTLTPDMLERFSLFVSGKLAASGRYQVIPRAQVKERLIQIKVESRNECNDSGCWVELGRAFAAEKTLSGDVLKMGSKCVVNLNIFDLRTEATSSAASSDGGCSEDDIVDSLSRAVASLLNPVGATVATSQAPQEVIKLPTKTDSTETMDRDRTDSSYRKVARALGQSNANVLMDKYVQKKASGATDVIADWDGAKNIVYKNFDIWTRDVLMKQKQDSWNAMWAGVAMTAFGVIVGVPLLITGSDDSVQMPGLAISCIFVPSGGITTIVGGAMYGVAKARLKKLKEIEGFEAVEMHQHGPKFALAPFVAPHNQGGGLQFMLGF